MSDDRKVRPEAVLKTLPPEKQQQVFNLIEGTTYALALAAIEQMMGIKTSQAALSVFRSWYLKRKLRRDMLDSVKIADVIDKQVDEAALDRAIAIKTKDLAWRELLAGRDKGAIQKLVQLSLENRYQDRQDKKLDRLMAAEKQRDEALARLAETEKRVQELLDQLNLRKQGAAEADPSKAMAALELFLGTKPSLQPAPASSPITPPEHAQGGASDPAAAGPASDVPAPGPGNAAPVENGSSVAPQGPAKTEGS